MISQKDYIRLGQMATMSMQVHRGRETELYESTNPVIVTKYFLSNEDVSTIECKFQLLIFNYDCDKKSVYVRYPLTNFFVELLSSAGSSRGQMSHYGGRNVIAEVIDTFGREYEAAIDLYVRGDMAMLKENSFDFDFLAKIGQKGLYSNSKDPKPDFGVEAIEAALCLPYVPLPDSRNIEYALVTSDGNYVVCDSSAYNYSYEGIVCRVGNFQSGFKQATISNFARFRDGGTTRFNATIAGVQHDFFYPSRLGHGRDGAAMPMPTWDNKVATDATEEEKKILADILGIQLAAKLKRV